MAEKYNASNIALEQILNYIKSGEIAIPEIQRPFVWKPRQVRDLSTHFIRDIQQDTSSSHKALTLN